MCRRPRGQILKIISVIGPNSKYTFFKKGLSQTSKTALPTTHHQRVPGGFTKVLNNHRIVLRDYMNAMNGKVGQVGDIYKMMT